MQGTVHFNILNNSVQADFLISAIYTTNIALIGPNEINTSLLQLKPHPLISYHGENKAYEPHKHFLIVQLQDKSPPTVKKKEIKEIVSNHDLSALEAAPQLDSITKSVQSTIMCLTYWSNYCTGSHPALFNEPK